METPFFTKEKSSPIRDDKFGWLRSLTAFLGKVIKPKNEWIQFLIILTICLCIYFVIREIVNTSGNLDIKWGNIEIKAEVEH